MNSVISYNSKLENSYESTSLPDELLSLYRRRTKLTQSELANLIGLKSDRMVRNWESGISLPVVKRLERLIEAYLNQDAFTPGNEREEIKQLWNSVKRMVEGTNERFYIYPIFDEHWLDELLSERSLFGSPVVSNNPFNNTLSLQLKNKPQPKATRIISHQVSALDIPQVVRVELANIPPVVPDHFIGREKEVTALCNLLDQATISEVTLVGPGGIGKTRLAMECTQKLKDRFKDGLLLIDVASISNEAQLTQILASELGIKEGEEGSLLPAIVDYLHDKQILVIFDNCEHLLDACARTIERLLATCRNLKILVTTREALNLASETILTVTPLSIHKEVETWSLKNVEQSEAITLFVERVLLAQPGFRLTGNNYEVVTEICQFLDGLPLALEIAATLVRALTVEQIAEQLKRFVGACFQLLIFGKRNTLTHLRSLKDAIDWSYYLLSPKEKLLLIRLSVFPGSFSLEEVEMKCPGENAGGNINDFEVVGILINLVNKSMVMAEENGSAMHYRLLNIVRQYSLEKLKLSEEVTNNE